MFAEPSKKEWQVSKKYAIFFILCEVHRIKLILFPQWVNIIWDFLLFSSNEEF